MSPSEAGTESSKRKHIVRAIAFAGLALAIALGFGFAAHRWPFGAAPPAEKLSLALSSTQHAALLHIAAAKGFLADEGLDVTVVPVSHGKAALELLAQGKVDLAAAAEVPFVISVLQGEPFGIAASMLGVSTEMAVVARRDRGITAPRDLVGKKVGVTLGTSGEYFLWAFLIRHKLPPDGVTMVNLGPGQIAQALASGTIDAASTWQPIRLNTETALGANAVSFTAPAAYTVTHVVVGRNEYLHGHDNALRKLVRALLKAEQLNRSAPEQALAVVAERLKIDVAALRSSWPELNFRVNLLQSHLVTLEDQARWAIARGHAPYGAVPNFLSHLYLDALLAERPERVTVVH
jgi:ABC-type nitrate/sulfonate/bicarbonate transport system substrate-binding protein